MGGGLVAGQSAPRRHEAGGGGVTKGKRSAFWVAGRGDLAVKLPLPRVNPRGAAWPVWWWGRLATKLALPRVNPWGAVEASRVGGGDSLPNLRSQR